MKKMLAFILAAALALLPGCNTPAPQAETSQEAPACTLELAGEDLTLEPRQEADGVHIPLEMAAGETLTLAFTATPGCQVKEAASAHNLVAAVVGDQKLILTAAAEGAEEIAVTCGGEGYRDCVVPLEVTVTPPALPLAVTCGLLPQPGEEEPEPETPEEGILPDAVPVEEEPETPLDPAIRYEDGKLALPVAASCALLLEAPEETVYTLTAPEGEAAAEVSLHPEGYLAITGLEVGSCAFTLEASHPDWSTVTLAVEVQVSLPALLVTPEAEGFLLDAPSLEQGKSGYRLTLAGLPEEAKVELRQDNENIAFSLVKEQLSITPKAVGVTKLNLDISCEGFQPLSLEYEFEVTTTKAAFTLNGGKSAATVWVEGSISLPIALGAGAELLLDYPKELVEVERVGNTLSVKGIAPGTAVLSATARKEGLADNLQRVTITVTPHQAVAITLGNRSLAGLIGQSQGVRITTNPADAKVTISGGGSIADCSYSGGVLTVTPFAPGSATIAVTASKAGYTTSTAYLSLTVAAQAGKITLWTSPTYLNLEPGKTGSFTIYATPKDATLKVSATDGFDCQLSGQRGTITAPDEAANGTVTVTASKEGFPEVTATVSVRVAAGWNPSGYTQRVFEIVNQERAKVGAAPLVYMDDLQDVVDLRAKEIYTKYSHTRPNGESFSSLLPDYSFCGENIYKSPRTPEAAMTGWMNSTGHRANILKPQYTGMAVGIYFENNTPCWVQIFFTPMVSSCTLCLGCTNTKPNHGCTGDPATCTCTCDLCKTLGNFYKPCTLCSGCTATGPNHGCTGDPRTCYCTCDGCKKLKEDFQNSLPCLVCTDCTKTGSNHGCTGDPATCTCDCAGCEKWRQLESSKPDPTPEPQPEPEPTPEPEPEPQPEPEPEPTPEPTPEPPPAEGEATPPADGSGETPAP